MASASTQPPEMRHRVKVRILVILASVLAFLAIFTSWIDQQLLDTNEWVHTSGRLLEDKEISDAVATYSVDQLYANVDVTRLIKNRLPGDLQQLASPASAGIREIATRAAMRAFQSQRVQNLWQDANRVAHTQLVAILEDKHAAISSQNGKVVLDLKPIVYQLADRLGFKKQVANAVSKGEQTGTLKPGFGQLEIADSKELDTARTVTKILNGLAWFFTIGSLALFVLAMWLGKGRDWVIVLGYGLGLIAAGLGAFAVRAILKGPFVDSLAKYRGRPRPGTARVGHRHVAAPQHRVQRDHLRDPVRDRRVPRVAAQRSGQHPPGSCADAAGPAGHRLVGLRGGCPARPDHLAAQRHAAAGPDAAPDRAGRRRHREAETLDGT